MKGGDANIEHSTLNIERPTKAIAGWMFDVQPAAYHVNRWQLNAPLACGALRRFAALFIAQGFRDTVARSGCEIYACSVLPDHTHLVVRRHRYKIEQLVIQLKGNATRHLIRDGVHPFQKFADARGRVYCMWGRDSWDVYLDTPEAIVRKIDYVRKNPVRAGLPKQKWSFVTEYRAT